MRTIILNVMVIIRSIIATFIGLLFLPFNREAAMTIFKAVDIINRIKLFRINSENKKEKQEETEKEIIPILEDLLKKIEELEEKERD